MQQAANSQAAAGAGMTAQADPAATPGQNIALLKVILASLEDDKAEDIVTIDLSGRSAMADHMVVCSGRSSRQVNAIAENLLERVKGTFAFSPRVEGRETGDWVLIDAGDVVVHVFRPEVREFYQLEKMWLPVGTLVPAAAEPDTAPDAQ